MKGGGRGGEEGEGERGVLKLILVFLQHLERFGEETYGWGGGR